MSVPALIIFAAPSLIVVVIETFLMLRDRSDFGAES